MQVAIHELLGHGSGKLFQEDADGKKNFDPEKVRYCAFPRVNHCLLKYSRLSTRSQENQCENSWTISDFHRRLTRFSSTSWYKPGQTPGSVLGEVSSSLEECRAEAVALNRM